MKVEIVKGNLVITIPVNNPLQPSKSGKTMLGASSGGNVVSEAVIEGKPVTIGLNAYIKRGV